MKRIKGLLSIALIMALLSMSTVFAVEAVESIAEDSLIGDSETVYHVIFEDGSQQIFESESEAKLTCSASLLSRAAASASIVIKTTLYYGGSHILGIRVAIENWAATGRRIQSFTAVLYAQSTSILFPTVYGTKTVSQTPGGATATTVHANSPTSCPGTGTTVRVGFSSLVVRTVHGETIYCQPYSFTKVHTH